MAAPAQGETAVPLAAARVDQVAVRATVAAVEAAATTGVAAVAAAAWTPLEGEAQALL